MDQVLQDLLDELSEHSQVKQMDLLPPTPSGGDEMKLSNGLTKETSSSSVILRQRMSKSSFEYKKRMCVALNKNNDLMAARSRKALHHLPNSVDFGALMRRRRTREEVSLTSSERVRNPFAAAEASATISDAR